jgi:hypothetical protein
MGRAMSLTSLSACVAALASGCGEGGPAVRVPDFAAPRDFDVHFYAPTPARASATAGAPAEGLGEEIERLAGPAWATARERLLLAGKDAVPGLIKNMDRTEPSFAALSAAPGPQVAEVGESATLGRVAYSVLLTMMANYSTYKGGDLPPFDKTTWVEWWAANSRTIEIRVPEETVPRHVRDAFEAQRKGQEAAREAERKRLEEELAAQPVRR